MKLNKQQQKLLFLIGRNNYKSMTEIGREIYSTNKSCYDVIYYFQEKELIELVSYKNKFIPVITIKGKQKIKDILKTKGL